VDPSPVDPAAGFTFRIDWGDGAVQTVTGPSGTQMDHTYAQDGTYRVAVTAVDREGEVSAPATQSIAVKPWAIQPQPDPHDPSKTVPVLVVGVGAGGETGHGNSTGWRTINIPLGGLLPLPFDRVTLYVPRGGGGDGLHMLDGLGLPIDLHALTGDGTPNEDGTDCGQHDEDSGSPPASSPVGDPGWHPVAPVADLSGGSGSTPPGRGKHSGAPRDAHRPAGRPQSRSHGGKGKAH
jgi:PKD repeat protein